MNRVKLRMERYACVQNTPEKPIASYFPAHSTSQPDDARLVQPRHVLHVCRFDRQTVRAARIVSANRSLRSASSSPAPGVTWTLHLSTRPDAEPPHARATDDFVLLLIEKAPRDPAHLRTTRSRSCAQDVAKAIKPWCRSTAVRALTMS